MPAASRTWMMATAAFASLVAMMALSAHAGSEGQSGAKASGAKAGAKSLLGSYMAGRVARSDHDIEAAASFYGHALKGDPANDSILTQSFEMEATEGNWEQAVPLAERLAKARPDHRMVRIFMGLKEFKSGRHSEAEAHLRAAAVNPIGELTSNLGRAWNRQAEGKTKDALDLLEQPKSPEWAQLFYRYHRALLLDVAGRTTEARAAYEKLYKVDNKSLRSAVAYAQHLSNSGDARAALAVLRTQLDRSRGDGHPVPRTLVQQIEAGEIAQLLVSNASEGMAEAFYGIGEALAGEGGISPGALFLQFALFLEPQHPFALVTLANLYEGAKQYDRSIAAYDRVPKGTSLAGAIEIRKAMNFSSLEKFDQAQKLLEEIVVREPDDLKPLDALGTLMRGQKRYEDAVNYYTRAINLIQKPDQRHWAYYYSRGTSYERLKRWPLAEADLQTALRLAPEQPMVLNYLGYSWIDQGRNLKQGMTLIEKAVKLKPDDGYIVDSLGWAHFKQGNFKEAVHYLERAVEIRPEDPTLNDHLGDALWRVGREREARFQWELALTLKPEADEIDKIGKKIKVGLPTLAPVAQPRQARQTQRSDGKRREVRNQPAPVFQQ